MNVYGPAPASRADADRATAATAAVIADPAASMTERLAAAEAEQAALESFEHAYGRPAWAEPADLEAGA